MGKLEQLQSEIAQTRERLTANLKVLTHEDSMGQLQDTFFDHARAQKNQAIEMVKTNGQGLANEFITSVKAKVAENPAAALAIGAGIGWKLWKDPPIASVLVGLGLYSLYTGATKTTAISETVSEKLAQTGETVAEGLEAGRASIVRTAERAEDLAAEAWGRARETVVHQANDLADAHVSARNAALLGVAGIAVAAAIGLAVQKFRDDE